MFLKLGFGCDNKRKLCYLGLVLATTRNVSYIFKFGFGYCYRRNPTLLCLGFGYHKKDKLRYIGLVLVAVTNTSYVT